MVMGNNSCMRGRVLTLICCMNCIVCLKKPNINKKRPALAHFFIKKFLLCQIQSIRTVALSAYGECSL